MDHVYWGPLGGPLDEVEVTVGKMKDNVSPLFGKLLYNHRYVVFENVSAGDYEWRWEVTAPWTGGVPVVFGAGEVSVVATP